MLAIGSSALRALGLPVGRPGDLDLVADPSERPLFDGMPVVSDSSNKTVFGGLRRVEVEWARDVHDFALLQRGADPSGAAVRHGLLGRVPVAARESVAAVYRATCLHPVQWSKNYGRWSLCRDAGWAFDPLVFSMRTADIGHRLGYDARRYDRPEREFFRDSVVRDRPHAELHSLLKLGPEPAYVPLLKVRGRTGLDPMAWNKLTGEGIRRALWEEALVTGWERWASKGIPRERAARLALRGLCTNFLPLWARPRCLDEMPALLSSFPLGVWDRVEGRPAAGVPSRPSEGAKDQ